MLFKVLLQLLSIKTSLILKVNILPYEGKVLFLFVFGSNCIKARHIQRSRALTITHLPTGYTRELYSKATIAGWEFRLCFKRQLLEIWLPTYPCWQASISECFAAAQKQSNASSFHFPLKLPFQHEKVLPWRADPQVPCSHCLQKAGFRFVLLGEEKWSISHSVMSDSLRPHRQ